MAGIACCFSASSCGCCICCATRRSGGRLRFCYLDGQTVERQAEVDRFQNDAGIPLFFISLKAGGTGLNLTGADTVIHFDPWWNPAVEEQATSRAHRMGQSRSVQAYKLIAAGTVEEKIQALQARKRELFQASLGGDEAFVEKLTGEDLEDLLTESNLNLRAENFVVDFAGAEEREGVDAADFVEAHDAAKAGLGEQRVGVGEFEVGGGEEDDAAACRASRCPRRRLAGLFRPADRRRRAAPRARAAKSFRRPP